MNPLTVIGISLTIIGMICTFLGQVLEKRETRDHFNSTINSQREEIARLQRENTALQLNATYYTEELSQTISNIWFKVKFKNPANISDLHPIRILITIEPREDNPKIWDRFFIESKESKRKGQLVPYYTVLSGKFQKGETVYSESVSYLNPTMDAIVVPLTFVNQDRLIIKDLHKKPFVVHLQDKIIHLADKVELIVNERLILDENISDAYWNDIPANFTLEVIGNVSDLKRAATNHPSKGIPYSLWTIDIYNKLAQKIEEFPYKEHPFMKVDFHELK